MKVQMLAAEGKAKPDTENTKVLNLSAVKFAAVQLTRLPL
jgi:hypothetical protein